MKRLLLVCLISAPAYGNVLKEINNSRLASAVKAAGAFGLGVLGFYVGGKAVKKGWDKAEGFDRPSAKAVVYNLTKFGGMSYTSYLLLRYSWYKACHAIGND